ncbi:MAG: type II secretion system F family protein [Actinomycetota bacterium]
MTILLGLVLGVGMLLAASPWLWPRGYVPARRLRSPLDLVRERLNQAGVTSVNLGSVLIGSAVLAIAVAALCFALVPVVALAAVAFVAGLGLPAIVIAWRARSRRRSTRVLWPDVVDHLVSAVRSGLALPDAVVALAAVGPPGARESFREFERDYRATGSFGLSLDALKHRLADPVADRILETLRMSREVGGTELTTVLRNLSSHLRQEAAIRLEVEGRQSWVVTSARLGAIAPWVILLLLAGRPEAAAAYSTPAGAVLIAAGAVITVVAYRVMLMLGRLPEDRRWFR